MWNQAFSRQVLVRERQVAGSEYEKPIASLFRFTQSMIVDLVGQCVNRVIVTAAGVVLGLLWNYLWRAPREIAKQALVLARTSVQVAADARAELEAIRDDRQDRRVARDRLTGLIVEGDQVWDNVNIAFQMWRAEQAPMVAWGEGTPLPPPRSCSLFCLIGNCLLGSLG